MKSSFPAGLSFAILCLLPSVRVLGQSIQDNLYTTNGSVYAVATSGNTIYIGGSFTSVGPVGGATVTRNYIAALDATTGAVTSWDPNADSWVTCLAVSGTVVYAGGYFDNMGGQARGKLAAIDRGTGSPTSWQPGADNTVFATAASATKIYAGGNFAWLGNYGRQNLASIDMSTTYDASTWNPSTSGTLSPVFALAVSGSTIYVGGSFGNIQGRQRIVALDATTGNIPAGWSPPTPNAAVRALAVSGATLYVAGDFTLVGSTARNHIAAFDAATGTPTAWDPNANGSILSLAVSGSTVYAGGTFSTIAGTSRNNLAALDASTNTSNATSWDPNANGTVRALAISASNATIYAGGDFTGVFSTAHAYIAGMTNAADITLPVELVGFNVVANHLNADLHWSTLTEVSSYGFEIERRVISSRSSVVSEWVRVGFVAASGTSTTSREYTFVDKVPAAGRYAYRIRQINNDGTLRNYREVEVEVGLAPREFMLSQNYPNPFNPSTTIGFTVPSNGPATLKIHNILGQEVATVFEGEAEAGRYVAVTFDVKGLASGMYFARLAFDGKSLMRKVILLK
ncbi:MAG: T9SS type A sorting domain-containing protein [Bacteroidota bacterium]